MKLNQLRRRCALLAAAMATILGWAASAHATILVDQASPYGGYSVGGYDWGAFTTALGAQPGGYQIGSVGDAAAVSDATALLIVARDNNFGTNTSLSAAEIANIQDFLGRGGRVAIIGDGDLWSNWNNAVVAFASGGTATVGPMVSGSTSPVVANDLTNSVTSALLQGAGVASGGTALFGQNFATLWGDNQNLLTVLDVNVLTTAPAPSFRDNVAAWLGTSSPSAAVPEPATWAMMIVGFGLVGGGLRRRTGQVRIAVA